MSDAIESQLVTHIEDARAMEETTLRMLDELALTIEDPQLSADFRRHRTQTERQVRRLEERLSAHKRRRSLVRGVIGIGIAVAKKPINLLRSQPIAREVRDAYANEHAEIATYELLERIAKLAGDDETVKVARRNRGEEVAMVKRIEDNWDRATQEALGESGVAIIETSTTPRTSKPHARNARSRSSVDRGAASRNGASGARTPSSHR
jgi:ferritin-like metal-binding protein YciE